MSSILDFLTTKEITIICVMIGCLLLIWLVLFVQEKYIQLQEKNKLKQNTQALNQLVEEKTVLERQDDSFKTKEEALPTETNETLEPVTLENMLDVAPPKMVEISSVQKVAPLEEKMDKDVLEKEEAIKDSILVAPPSEITTKKEEAIEYKEEVYTQTEAQQELERLTKELEKEEVPKIELTEFEAKQEENAIISLEELLIKGKSLVLENEEVQYQDEGNEPISIQDLEQRIQQQVALPTEKTKDEVNQVTNEKQEVVASIAPQEQPVKVQLDDFYTASKKPLKEAYPSLKKYTPSPVISPVFGLRQEEKVVHNDALQLENTANFEKLDEEIRKTNEFLAILKELQKKLD